MLCVEVAVLLRADQAQRRAVREAQRLAVETVSEQDILLQGVFDVHDRPVTVEAAEDDMRYCRNRRQPRLDDRAVEGRESDALPAQSDRRPARDAVEVGRPFRAREGGQLGQGHGDRLADRAGDRPHRRVA